MQAESQGQEQCQKGLLGPTARRGWGQLEKGGSRAGREGGDWVGHCPNLVATSVSGRGGKAEGPGLSYRYKARVGRS